jgi:hypothetical protein
MDIRWIRMGGWMTALALSRRLAGLGVTISSAGGLGI